MADNDQVQLLLDVATRGENEKDRADAAALYKQMTGRDVPGAATSPPPATATPGAQTQPGTNEPEPPGGSGLWGTIRRTITPDEPDAPFWGAAARELGSELRSAGYAAGLPIKPAPRDIEANDKLALAGERASNALTLGASRGVMDPLHASSPQQREELASRYPGGAFFGDLLGNTLGFWMGGPRMISRAAGEAVEQAATRFAPRLTDAARGLITGPVDAVAQNAAMNASNRRPLLENVGTAAAVGAGGAALGEMAQGGANVLRKGRWIGRYASAKERGLYERPDVRETKDAQQAAEQAREGFDRRNAQLEDEAGAELARAREPYLQDEVSRRALLRDIRQRLNDNTEASSGRPKDPRLEKALLELADEIGPYARRGAEGRMEPIDDPTYQDIIDRKEALRRKAFGSPSESQEMAREKYDVLREGVQRNIPARARAAEEKFHESAVARRNERDIVRRSEKNVNRGDADEPDVPVSKEIAAMRFFKRAGDANVPGEEMRTYHEQLAAADPVYADLLERVKDIKAREAMRPGFSPRVPPSFSGMLNFGGIPAGLEQLILRPALGRLVEPTLSRAAGSLPRIGTRLVPLLRDPLDAIRESRRRQEE